ncbi:MAG: hypothetical protein PPP58_04525 [Natronomonas sp.]
MDIGRDTRGVAPVIGFILVFGIGILALSTYQAVAVPSQNEAVEFEHFQEIQEDFELFQSTVVNAANSGEERSATFTLGTQYPQRTFTINPPPPSGTLETTEAGEVEIRGSSTAQNRGALQGSFCGGPSESRSVVYTPNYNELQNAQAITYENRFTATQSSGGTFLGSQRLVRDDDPRVGLILVYGDISTSSSGTTRIDVEGSGVESTEMEDLEIVIPSLYTAEQWETRLLDGIDFVEEVNQDGERVEIVFDPEEAIEVSCANVGLNEQPPTPEEPEFEQGGGGNGPPGEGQNSISNVEAGNVQQGPSETQDVSFRFRGAVEEGDTVRIEFPQGEGDTEQNSGIDYLDATESVMDGDGEIRDVIASSDVYSFDYVAGADDSPGEGNKISIRIDGVDTSEANTGPSYTVVFTHEDDDESLTDDFDITN